MITGRFVRGAFTRIASLATGAGSKALLRMAPKAIMDSSSIGLGRILGNPRVQRMVPHVHLPSVKSLRHMAVLGGFGSVAQAEQRYQTGTAFFTFAKKKGLQANHAATDGLGLALFRGRHTNLL